MSRPLRVAIVHYHLRPGGVTSVIERAVEALRAHGVRTVVLCGNDADNVNAGPVRCIPGLAYDGQGNATALARALLDAARDALGDEPHLLHAHNHAVGKSSLFPLALRELARLGKRLLLQIHDFAEDGRPANFAKLLGEAGRGSTSTLGEILYPVGPHVHYALLNLRDRALVMRAGLPDPSAHYLPNSVTGGEARPPPAGPPLFVYPTRAIRRKNLGEFLLWSAVSGPETQWATSLAPRSAGDRAHYDAWVRFAGEMKLPVEFEAGIRRRWSLADLLREASAIVTTSIAEGFGLAYLEPWLAGRPLVGRNLPDVTLDMAEAGLELDHLYQELTVPLAWIGADRLRKALTAGLTALYGAYGRRVPEGALEKAAHGIGSHEEIDFGRLDEAMQRDVIRNVVRDPSAAAMLRPARLVPEPVAAATLSRNQAVARRAYGPERYAERLLGIYERLVTSEPGPLASLSVDAILDGFLDPHRFRLLRT